MSAVDRRVGTGASRVRRLLSRALLVAGGALAGTAAAWALSASPAVAADHDVVGGITAHGPLHEALAPIGQDGLGPVGVDPDGLRSTGLDQTVRELGAALHPSRVREPKSPDLGRVADEIRGTVEHVGAWLQPRSSTSSKPAKPVVVDGDAVGGTQAQPTPETTPPTTAVPVDAGTPVVTGVFGELSRLWLDQAPGTAPVQAADPGSSLPGDPSGLPLMPFAPPLGVPAHCTCGGDASGSSGGGSGSYATASAHPSDTAVARALFPATVRNVVMPGKQPGITPD
ncbi:hypothetical protein [Saccharothrix xinjiangensis]|uniref:Secreted protein n=1 Tax=Saccharothrix xinjiangensis TaxID=204798 RepID=A0ABV9Y5W5_9PSEU